MPTLPAEIGRGDPTHLETPQHVGQAEIPADRETTETAPRVRGVRKASWGRFPEDGDEAAFLVVLGRASRKVALSARIFCALAWCLGARQVAGVLNGDSGESLRRGQRWCYYILLFTQISVVLRELVSLVQLWRSSTPDQARISPNGAPQGEAPPELFHDIIKYKTLEYEAIATMVCVIQLGPGHFTFAQGLKGLYFNSFVSVIDQMRMESAVKLHIAKIPCLVLMEVGRWINGHVTHPLTLASDLARYCVFGVALPLLIHAILEARMRQMFLDQYHRPRALLPAIFEKALVVMNCVLAPANNLKQYWISSLTQTMHHSGHANLQVD